MANKIAYYFLVPTWDFPPPPLGPIQLGNVLMSVKMPERALYRAPITDDQGVFSTAQKKVTFSTDKLLAGRFGVFTRFLSLVLGIGVDAEVGWEANDISRFSFDNVETTQFIPEAGYIQSCIAAAPVKRYLEKSSYRKPVYIITGIKTVSGVKAETLRARGKSASISAEADATAWAGVPISGGPELGGNKRSGKNTTWEGPGDFIFAFRVREVFVKEKTGMVKSEEDYTKGALLDNATEERSEPELDIDEEDFFNPVSEGFRTEELMDDDEPVLCAIPTIDGVPTRLSSAS